MAEKGTQLVRSLATPRIMLGVATGLALVLVPVLYASLASSNPGAALITSSLAGLLAFGFGTFFAWPMERKITWQRQLEVFGYRALAALAAYVVMGVGLLFLLNAVTEQVVPLDWPGEALRRVPFWPFYTLVILACQGLLPTPPGAC